MKRVVAIVLLFAVFFLTFFLRIAISLQSEHFSYDAYLSLRQIENINERGVPLFNDPLSYGGRVHLFPPVFYYLVSFFDFVGLNLAAKIISNLFFSLIVFAVYLISFQITNHRLISVMTSFFSSFIPLLFGSINEISIYSSVLLLTFFAVYFIININNNTHLNLAMFFWFYWCLLILLLFF